MLSAPGDHPCHQARDLHRCVRSSRARDREVIGEQLRQPGSLGQAQRRHQPSRGHEIGVIEISAERVRNSHYRVLLMLSGLEPSTSPILTGHRSIRLSRPTHAPLINRRIQVQSTFSATPSWTGQTEHGSLLRFGMNSTRQVRFQLCPRRWAANIMNHDLTAARPAAAAAASPPSYDHNRGDSNDWFCFGVAVLVA